MQKQGTLNLTLSPPEYHAMHHLQTNRLKHYMFAGLDVIFNVSQTAESLVKSGLTNMGIQDLYCQVSLLSISANAVTELTCFKILTNNMSIHHPIEHTME